MKFSRNFQNFHFLNFEIFKKSPKFPFLFSIKNLRFARNFHFSNFLNFPGYARISNFTTLVQVYSYKSVSWVTFMRKHNLKSSTDSELENIFEHKVELRMCDEKTAVSNRSKHDKPKGNHKFRHYFRHGYTKGGPVNKDVQSAWQ